MYLLDTDHVSLDQRGHPVVTARIEAAGPSQVAISIVTVEEQMRGWLAVIRAAKTGAQLTAAYARLHSALEYFASTLLIDYSTDADQRYDALRREGIRIGSHDLRIAAIALVLQATVVTRNRRDFAFVPGLEIEDWSMS